MALLLGLRAARGHDMNLEQWTVGGRGFGTVFVFLLMAGEIYTTFTFLGGSGFAYGQGAPVYYILGYGSARLHHFVLDAAADLALRESPPAGLAAALLRAQVRQPGARRAGRAGRRRRAGSVSGAATQGPRHHRRDRLVRRISPTSAIWIGAAVVTAYVMVSGVRGSAWNAVVKDALILAVVLFLGIYLPIHYYGGFGQMFRAIDAAKPGFLALPAQGESVTWFQSTCCSPRWASSCGRTRSARCSPRRTSSVFRRNAIVLPLYQLILLFVFFVGFAAVLKVPGPEGRRYRPVAVPLCRCRLSIPGSSA